MPKPDYKKANERLMKFLESVEVNLMIYKVKRMLYMKE